MNAQELANRIGAAQRATEAAINTGNLSDAASHALEQHELLREAFAYVRDVLGVDLDWNQVAGQDGARSMAARGGGAKDPPPQSQVVEG